jgi:hypothetical protein
VTRPKLVTQSALLELDAWAGRGEVRVTVLSESIRHYRVPFEQRAFQYRRGMIKRVPKSAVVLSPQHDESDEASAERQHGR